MPDEPIPAALTSDPPLTEEQVDLYLEAVEGGTSPSDLDRAVEEPEGPWRIRSDREAEWAMRLLAQATKRRDEVGQQYAEWAAELNRWLAAESRRPKATIAFFGYHLRMYQAARREADPNAATLRLPSGQVKSHSVPETVVITDGPLVAMWATTSERWDVLKVEPLVSLLRLTVQVEALPQRYRLGCGCEGGWAEKFEVGQTVICMKDHTGAETVVLEVIPPERVAVDKKSGLRVPGTTVVPEHFEVSDPKPNGGAR